MDLETKGFNKKKRKFSKHFPILINGNKVNIINYRFQEKFFKIQGKYECGFHEPGNYIETYEIVKIEEELIQEK